MRSQKTRSRSEEEGNVQKDDGPGRCLVEAGLPLAFFVTLSLQCWSFHFVRMQTRSVCDKPRAALPYSSEPREPRPGWTLPL